MMQKIDVLVSSIKKGGSLHTRMLTNVVFTPEGKDILTQAIFRTSYFQHPVNK